MLSEDLASLGVSNALPTNTAFDNAGNSYLTISPDSEAK